MSTEKEIRASMTPEQIQLERKLTCEAIDGAIAFGYLNTNPPPTDDHWLAPFWKIGRKQRELESLLAANSEGLRGKQELEAFAVWLKGPHENNFNDRNHPLTVGEQIAASKAWFARAALNASLQSAEPDVYESLLADVTAIDTWYRGSPSYEHDAGWFKDRVVRLIEERIGSAK